MNGANGRTARTDLRGTLARRGARGRGTRLARLNSNFGFAAISRAGFQSQS
jgi:hypothetical protein